MRKIDGEINAPSPYEIVLTPIAVAREMSALVIVDGGKKKDVVAKTTTKAKVRLACSRR